MKEGKFMTRNEFLREFGGVSLKAQELNHIMQNATNVEDFAFLGLQYHFNFNQVLSNQDLSSNQIDELATKNNLIFDEIVIKAVLK